MQENIPAKKNWLSEVEAAKYLNCSQASLRRWRIEGRSPSKVDCTPPPCSSCGGRYLYNQQALDDWLVSMAVVSAKKNSTEYKEKE